MGRGTHFDFRHYNFRDYNGLAYVPTTKWSIPPSVLRDASHP
jgi:hypothetical protein